MEHQNKSCPNDPEIIFLESDSEEEQGDNRPSSTITKASNMIISLPTRGNVCNQCVQFSEEVSTLQSNVEAAEDRVSKLELELSNCLEEKLVLQRKVDMAQLTAHDQDEKIESLNQELKQAKQDGLITESKLNGMISEVNKLYSVISRNIMFDNANDEEQGLSLEMNYKKSVDILQDKCKIFAEHIKKVARNWIHLESKVREELAKTKEIAIKLQRNIILQESQSTEKKDCSSQTEVVCEPSGKRHCSNQSSVIKFATSLNKQDKQSTLEPCVIREVPPAPPATTLSAIRPMAIQNGVHADHNSTDDVYIYQESNPSTLLKPRKKRKYERKLNSTTLKSLLGSTNQAETKQSQYNHCIENSSSVNGFKCKCGIVYKHKSSLITHIRVKQTGKAFPCTVCNKRFARHHSMQSHMRNVHLQTNSKSSRRRKKMAIVERNEYPPGNNIPPEPAPPPTIPPVQQPPVNHCVSLSPGRLAECWHGGKGTELGFQHWMKTSVFHMASSLRHNTVYNDNYNPHTDVIFN